MALTWEQSFAVLREKSTIAGLTGLGVAVAAMFGHNVSPQGEMVITEIVLMVISIVAIATRPREPSRYNKPETWHDRADDDGTTSDHTGSDRRAVRAGDDSQEPAQGTEAAQERDQNS